MSAAKIPVIGVIGGIGSGKTAIAKALGQLISVCLLDADLAGHEVLKLPQTKEALKKTFDHVIFDESGEVNRSDLARLVFGKEEKHQFARKQLDSITHPEIRKFLNKQLKEIQQRKNCDIVILDAALLLEAGWSEECDAIVFLNVPEHVRLKRVLQRGWTEQQFHDREQSQLPLATKRQRSDFTLRNDGDIEVAAEKLADWINKKYGTTPQTSHSTD